MIFEVNKDNFEEVVLKSDKPVLLDFWGPSCGPCRALMPVVEKLAEEYSGKVRVCKLNSAENLRLCINLRVISLPTFILFAGGREISRIGPEIKGEDVRKCFNQLEVLADD